MRRAAICLLAALLTTPAMPAGAQWAVQRLDQYGMVTSNPREAVETEAFVDGSAGWRMRMGCAPGGQWVLMLRRRDSLDPTGGAVVRVMLRVADRQGGLIHVSELTMQWARRTYEALAAPALVAALAQGNAVQLLSGGRMVDSFGLGGSGAALGAVGRCQVPQPVGQAPVPGPAPAPERRARTDAWQYADGGGVWASAQIVLPGAQRSITFFCTRPDRARFIAWAQRTPDANHVPFVPDGFQMEFSTGLWPERLASGSPLEDHDRRLRLVVGARQLDGVVQHAGPEDYFLVTMGFGAPLFAVIEEGEQAGERLLVREGERVLAAVPLAGASAAIARARTFCGGPGAERPAALPPR